MSLNTDYVALVEKTARRLITKNLKSYLVIASVEEPVGNLALLCTIDQKKLGDDMRAAMGALATAAIARQKVTRSLKVRPSQ